MEFTCKRDICIREQCPAKDCNAESCVVVCKSFLEVVAKYEKELEKLERQYTGRGRTGKGKRKENFNEKEALLADQFRNAKSILDEKYREKRLPFAPCGHKFEIPDDTPNGASVTCPSCGGESTFTIASIKNKANKYEDATGELFQYNSVANLPSEDRDKVTGTNAVIRFTSDNRKRLFDGGSFHFKADVVFVSKDNNEKTIRCTIWFSLSGIETIGISGGNGYVTNVLIDSDSIEYNSKWNTLKIDCRTFDKKWNTIKIYGDTAKPTSK